MQIINSSFYEWAAIYLTIVIPNIGMPLNQWNSSEYFMVEICNNAIDDDMDGLIDLNDEDCDCLVVEPISFIPNPSFEDQNCCPGDRSELSCAAFWIQASLPTTNYIHSCGYFGWDDFPPPVPFPDGEGIMGFRDGRVRNNNDPEPNWKEYAGACLIRPLEEDSTYRFDFDVGFVNTLRSPPINITFFGTADCQYLPFGQSGDDFGCPTNSRDWVKLGSVRVSGDGQNTWVKASIEVTPDMDINAIAIGPECAEIPTSVSLYYFFDNLLLADIRAFDLQIKEQEHPCQNNYTLRVANNSAVDYQWCKDGVALMGETLHHLTVSYGDGEYQVLIDDGSSCKVSGKFNYVKLIISNTINLPICNEDTYDFGGRILDISGTYTHTFTTIYNCDSIVMLNLRVLGKVADTVAVTIFEGETFEIGNQKISEEGDYPITLQSSIGCDSLVLLQLDYYHIYFPNVFSPNQDGANDVFTLFHQTGLVQGYSMQIFDRWGNLVYEGQEWDGNHNGKAVNAGVFVYQADVRMNDGVVRFFTGTVSVMR